MKTNVLHRITKELLFHSCCLIEIMLAEICNLPWKASADFRTLERVFASSCNFTPKRCYLGFQVTSSDSSLTCWWMKSKDLS